MKKMIFLPAMLALILPALVFSAERVSFACRFSVIQNGHVVNLKDRLTTIRLKKAPFQIRFFLQDSDLVNYAKLNAVQIAVWTNSSIFESIADDVSNNEIACFSDGTGMASSGIYDSIFLDDRAHHYIVYDPKVPADCRAVSVKDLGNGWREAEWPVKGVTFPGQNTVTPMESSALSGLYLALLQDTHDVSMVNAGEYRLLKIIFER